MGLKNIYSMIARLPKCSKSIVINVYFGAYYQLIGTFLYKQLGYEYVYGKFLN